MDPNAQRSSPASGARKQSAPRPPRFDTMRAVGNLKEAEFREHQAVAIVETIRDSQVEFATKDDLHATRDDLRTELEKLELVLRNEIGKLRSEMRDEIGGLRSEMHGEISGLKNEMQNQFAMMYWRFLIGAGIIVGILGTMITLAVGK